MPAPHKLVVVGDELLIKLAAKAIVTSEFPFLAELKGLGGCGCKQKHKAGGRATKIANAKQALAQLPDAKKAVFKKMVNAEKVRVAYQTPGGGAFKTEF